MSTVAGSSPYPWPWDGDLSPERLALVVTGWDERWHGAVGSCPGVLAAIATLGSVVDRTVTVGHPPAPRRPDGPTLRVPHLAAVHLEAAGVDGFYGSALGVLLRSWGTTTLLLAGLGLETTVHSTMRTANDTGIECLCVIDACGPLDPSLTPRAVSMIEMSGGIFGAVATTDAVVAALAGPRAATTETETTR